MARGLPLLLLHLPDFVALIKKALRPPIPLAARGIRLIDLIARRFNLMFLRTGVIHVTTAGKLAAKEKST
jgi:hypothetical protein